MEGFMSSNLKAVKTEYFSNDFENDFMDEMVPHIPLPNELPPIPNLSDLPPQVLHSGTVETLLGQNEDLFARLKVSFKTNAELERKLMINEQNEMELKHINSSLLAQIQVLQEKDKAQKSRHEELEAKIYALNTQLESEKQAAQNSKMQFSEKADAFEALRTKLFQATTHIESQDQAIRDLEKQLNANFEERLNQVISENQRLNSELKEATERAEKLKNISELRAESENKLVFFERRAEELESRYSKDISDIQNQLAVYRTEAKSLSLQLHNTEAKLDDKSAECVRMKESLTEAQDQFESLQTLWAEAQNRLEESRLKYDSLHRINQELSRKLKEQRTQTEVQTFHSVNEIPKGKEEKFERLENLLAGIQAGFPQSVSIIDEDSDESENFTKSL